MVMIIFQIINQMIKPISMFNKTWGWTITNQSKGSSNVTKLFEISIGIANVLGCSHVANVRGSKCWPNVKQYQYLLLIMLLEGATHLNLSIGCHKHSLFALLFANVIWIEIYLFNKVLNLITIKIGGSPKLSCMWKHPSNFGV